MARIFLSHSSKDKEFVRKLGDDLKALGHTVWLDEWEIKVGDCIVSKIEQGLSGCDYVVLVLSPDAVASKWVDREWKAKYWDEVEKNKVTVLPVLAVKCSLPQLIKTRKYADFTSNYSLGLVHLTAAITPTVLESSDAVLKEPSQIETEVSALVEKIQSKGVLLSQCISEALEIGRRADNSALVAFCTGELVGPRGTKHGGKSEELIYRTVWAYASGSLVNLNYIGWGGDTSAMFHFMQVNPKQFTPVRLLIPEPIAKLEEESRVFSTKGIGYLSQPHKQFDPSSVTPDATVHIYFRGDAYADLVETIRAELTRRLLDLLPPLSPRA